MSRYPSRAVSIKDAISAELRRFVAPMIIETREKIRIAQGKICPYCGEPLRMMDATVDHVLPKSCGGLDGPGNLLAACSNCNTAKGDRLPTGCQLVWVYPVNARMGWEPDRW